MNQEKISEFNGSNEGKTSLNLLSMSTIVPLIFSLWWRVRKSRERGWQRELSAGLNSSREHRMYLRGRVCALNWAQPLNLQKWRLMEKSPAMASTPKEREVRNMPRIQMAALYYMWFSILSEYDNGAFL